MYHFRRTLWFGWTAEPRTSQRRPAENTNHDVIVLRLSAHSRRIRTSRFASSTASYGHCASRYRTVGVAIKTLVNVRLIQRAGRRTTIGYQISLLTVLIQFTFYGPREKRQHRPNRTLLIEPQNR